MSAVQFRVLGPLEVMNGQRRALEPGRPARTPARVLITQPPDYRLVVAPGDLDAAAS